MVVSQNKTLQFFFGPGIEPISKTASIGLKPYLRAIIFKFLIIMVKILIRLERIEVHFRTIISMDPLNRPPNVAKALHDVYIRIVVQNFSDERRQEV